MALLTVPTHLPNTDNFVSQVVALRQQLAAEDAKQQEQTRLRNAALQQAEEAAFSNQRRVMEFAARNDLEKQRLDMEKQIFTDERAPFDVAPSPARSVASIPLSRGGGGSSPQPTPPMPTQAPKTPLNVSDTPAPLDVPPATPGGSAPKVVTGGNPPPESPASTIPGLLPPAPGETTPRVVPAIPVSTPRVERAIPVIQPDGTPSTPPAPGGPVATTGPAELMPAPHASTPADQIRELAGTLSSLNTPGQRPVVNRKMGQEILKSAIPGIIAKKESATANSPISQWPKNERGYRFDPSNPASQFEERWSPRGVSFKQVKESDPEFGMTPVGDGLYEDRNGARYFKDQVSGRGPVLKRVEQDDKIAFHATDSDGRVHSYNQFGKETGVTDDTVSFLKPSTKPMVGSDGKVYPFDVNAAKFTVEPPANVRFDKAAEAKAFKVGTDGQMYAFNGQGQPVNEIPQGVRFDHPSDPEKVTEWRFDEAAKKLVGFNYKGDRIAENEGQFSKLRQGAAGAKAASLPESTTYEALRGPVHNLWGVYDKIRTLAGDPNAAPDELRKYGEVGVQLNQAREQARKSVDEFRLKGKRPGINFAEGFVRSFETRQMAQTPDVPAAAAAAAPTAAPAAPAAPAATPAPIPNAPQPPAKPEWREGMVKGRSARIQYDTSVNPPKVVSWVFMDEKKQ